MENEKLNVYSILSWAKQNGKVRDLDRIRLMVLPYTLKHGIKLLDVLPETDLPEDLIDKILLASEKVIGQKFIEKNVSHEKPEFSIFRRSRV